MAKCDSDGLWGLYEMLLHRVIDHFRKQEWTAIGIDFVIVVIGVFVGIQVANWNSTRLAHEEERRLVAQLADDVDMAIFRSEDWIARTSGRLDSFLEAVALIQADGPEAQLTRIQCEATAYSHVVDIRTSSLPTLDEILSTDGLGILTDPKLRRALLRYQAGHDEIAAANQFIRNDFANLVDSYGTAFPRRLADQVSLIADIPVPSRVECRAPDIAADANLQNRLMSNLSRTKALIENGRVELGLLQDIRAVLAEDAQ